MKKKRIHRIGNSKEPTPQIMMKIAENLRTKFNGYANISMSTIAYTGGDTKTEFWISGDSFPGKFRKPWPKALAYYRELMKTDMKGKQDGS